MRDENDIRGVKLVRNELTRRGFDIGRAAISVSHGICRIQGIVGGSRCAQFHDIDEEMHHAMRALRQKPELRDVVLDCTLKRA